MTGDSTTAAGSGVAADAEQTRSISAVTPGQERAHPPEAVAGSRIGRYTIIRCVGEGGMGRVYSAHDPNLGRQVALKILGNSQGQDLSNGSLELLREAQTLAKLNHPNIVNIYDVGFHDGSHYIAMELVEGITLNEWMKAKKRHWTEVVDVMLAAGRGVEAAHKAGIVHRDFKPGNVMIGDDGRVRVMDFGIATTERVVVEDPDPTPRDRPATGTIIGTPSYMAPEQLRGESTGMLADQFSFCVTLFRALYGKHPFVDGYQASELTTHLDRISRGQVLEVPRNSGAPKWLSRIVLQGMQPLPDHRFASMTALLLALESGRSRRKRGAWVAGALVTFTAVTLSGISFMRARTVCDGAAEQLAPVWNDAVRDDLGRRLSASAPGFEGTAAQTTAALQEYAGSWVNARTEVCQATNVRREQSPELMDFKMACLDERQAELAALIGLLNAADLGLAARSTAAVRELSPVSDCLKSARFLDEVRDGVPSVDRELATRLAEVRAHYVTAEYAVGLELIDRLMADLADEESDLSARAKVLRGRLLEELGKFDAALETFRSAFITAVRARAREISFEATLAMAAIASERLERPDEALQWHSVAGAYSDDSDADHAAQLAHILGKIHYRSGDFVRAFEELASAVSIRRESRSGRFALAGSLLTYSVIAYERGDNRDSLEKGREAAELFEQEVGEYHPQYAAALTVVALTLLRMRDYEEGKAAAQRVVDIRTRVFGEEHPDVAAALSNLAIAYTGLNDFEYSMQLRKRALAIHESTGSSGRYFVGVIANNIAATLQEAGNFEEGMVYQQRAEEAFLEAVGPDHPILAHVEFGYGMLLNGLGRTSEALGRFESALAIRRKHMPPNSVGIAQAAATVGMVLLELERPRDSIALLTEAMGIYDGQESAPAERIEPRLLLAAAYQQTGQAIQAKTIAQEAVEILHEEPQDAIRASAYWSLGKVLWEVAERQRAGELVLRARNMYLDLDSPNEVAELERWLRQRSIEFH